MFYFQNVNEKTIQYSLIWAHLNAMNYNITSDLFIKLIKIVIKSNVLRSGWDDTESTTVLSAIWTIPFRAGRGKLLT